MSLSREEIENILSQYKPLVLKLAKGYYIQGGDFEDLIQEGMIALYSSIFTYNESKSGFSTYAYMCISSRLKNVVKKDMSNGTRILSEAIDLHSNLELASETSIEEQYMMKEEMRLFRVKLEEILSPLEFQVVELYLKGHNYKEISDSCNINQKSVDNAFCRAKKKIAQSI